jgi:hypothetical protein
MPVSRKLGNARLLALADYLEKNKIPRLDMSTFRKCVASHVPDVFPKYWDRNSEGYPQLKGQYTESLGTPMRSFFSLRAEYQTNGESEDSIFYVSGYNSNHPQKATAIKKIRQLVASRS